MKYTISISGNNKKIQIGYKQSLNIGRIEEYKGIKNQLVDDDLSVSRYHATILNKKKGLIIVDQNSQNGTFLNDGEIQKDVQVTVEPGDQVRLGNSKRIIRVSVVEEDKGQEQDERQRSREHKQNEIISSSTLKLLKGMKGKGKNQMVKFLKLMGHKTAEKDWDEIQVLIKGTKNQQFQKINKDLDEQFNKVSGNKGKRQLQKW